MISRFFALILTTILVSNQLCNTVQAASATFDQDFYSGNDILFYDPRCKSGQASGSLTLAGKDNLEKILNFLMRKGLTLAQASGVAGNLMAESGLDPAIIQGGGKADDSYMPEAGIGFGLAQWTSGNRQEALVQHIKDMGVGLTDLGGQLDYLWTELSSNYQSTLSRLQATSTPLDAAVVFHNGYEGSADSIATVEANRGGNATKFYNMYSDAPALAGSTATSEMNNPSGNPNAKPQSSTTNSQSSSCVPGFGGGDLLQTLRAYAWPEYRGLTTVATDDYKTAVQRAISVGRYVGGEAYPGIDCGGFVTTLIVDSGFDKNYNYGSFTAKGAGFTDIQETWLKANWEPISGTDAADRHPGDVAINDHHTYVYVGPEAFPDHIPIASASLDERAPMQGQESVINVPGDDSFRWYRIKA